jgi:hypothetical protein
MVLMRTRRVWRAWRMPDNLDLYATILICAVSVACLLLGWRFRPTASSPPLVPSAPMLTINFSGPQPAPRELDISSVLVRESDSQTELKVDLAGVFEPGQTTVGWSVAVQQFTGRICTPKPYQAPVRYIGPQNYSISATSPVATNGTPFTLIHLCWSSNSPLAITSSYLNANLPAVFSPPPEAGTVTRVLQVVGTSLAGYDLVGGIAPAILTPPSWKWQSSYGGNSENQAEYPIPVFASSIIGVQQANSDTFYSGIFFGVAGGALISVLLGLPDLVKRRRDLQRTGAKEPADVGSTQDGGSSRNASPSLPS